MSNGSNAARWWVAIAIGTAGYAFVRLRTHVPIYMDLHTWLDQVGVSDGVRNLDNWLLLIITAFLGAWVVGRREGIRSLGLGGPIPFGVCVGLLAATPMITQAAIAGDAPHIDGHVAEVVLLAPFVEELFFRGLLVAIPVALCRAHFWPCAIFSALLFGSAHVPWSDALTVNHVWPFLVTGLAGGWFAWVMRCFDWNLWVSIALHTGMNGAWLIFGVGGGAVGNGLWPNLGRAVTITVGTMLALRYRRRNATA